MKIIALCSVDENVLRSTLDLGEKDIIDVNRYVQLLIVCKVGSISSPAKLICRKSDSVIEQKQIIHGSN